MATAEVATDEQRFVGYFEHFPRIAAVVAILIGATVLTGWGLDIPALRGIGDTANMMPTPTAMIRPIATQIGSRCARTFACQSASNRPITKTA